MDSESQLISRHWTTNPVLPLKRAGWLYEFLFSFGHHTRLQRQMASILDIPQASWRNLFFLVRRHVCERERDHQRRGEMIGSGNCLFPLLSFISVAIHVRQYMSGSSHPLSFSSHVRIRILGRSASWGWPGDGQRGSILNGVRRGRRRGEGMSI